MKHLTIIALLIIVSSDIYSQTTRGLIIRKKDTLEVNFKMPNVSHATDINYKVSSVFLDREKIKYFNAEGKKKVLKFSEVEEVQFFFGDSVIRMIRHINPFQAPCDWCEPQYFFLRLLIDGEMKLLKYNLSKSGFGSALNDISLAGRNIVDEGQSGNNPKFFYQKGGEEIFIPNVYLFRKEMRKYLSDCEELIEKIETKEYIKYDAFKIVEFYNSYCGK
jgi:hypothetical protein